MALTADYTKIKNYQDLVYIHEDPADPKSPVSLNPVTHSLVFACMAIGLGEITEKNVVDYATRLRVWETGVGTFLQMPDGEGNLVPRTITYHEVEQHIGLHTNAFPNLTTAAFAKKLASVMTDQAAYKIKRERS